MIELNFKTDFDIGAPDYKGIGHLEIGELEGRSLNLLQKEITVRLGEKQKKTKDYMRSHGIVIDTGAIHEEIERIIGLDNNTLNALEKEIKTKLEQKKKELETMVKFY